MTLTMRASRPLDIPEEMEALLRYGRGPALPPPQVRPETTEGGGWGCALDVTALNDVVLEKLARDRQVGVGVYLAGRLLATYSADALAVATPTGSTAYSFAAGGPVLSPHMDALVFTPIAPHMTFNRSVVAAPDEPVGLRVLPHSGQAAVSVDGQLRGVLDPGDWIGVFRAPSTRPPRPPPPHRLLRPPAGPVPSHRRPRQRPGRPLGTLLPAGHPGPAGPRRHASAAARRVGQAGRRTAETGLLGSPEAVEDAGRSSAGMPVQQGAHAGRQLPWAVRRLVT